MNWQFLEYLQGLDGVPALWQQELGEDFPAFNTLCLQPEDWLVEYYPCSQGSFWDRVSYVLRAQAIDEAGESVFDPKQWQGELPGKKWWEFWK